MTPNKDGGANHGHSCVKGRFAWGYTTHKDRITTPMIRKSIKDPWQKVSWEEAINYAASEIKRIQQKYGSNSVGAISSSRCTNEEVYLMQKIVRAGFGNNNIDTCARVCHSPTGYGLKQTIGESAGTQNFDSVMKSDVIMIVGANPTDGHPVFASQMKRRLREGAKLIIVDPREIDLVDNTPHIKADYHLKLRPSTNVATINSIAHVIVEEGLSDQNFVKERCEDESFKIWLNFIKDPKKFSRINGIRNRYSSGFT
jgi:formate dehydrogenase major subunit